MRPLFVLLLLGLAFRSIVFAESPGRHFTTLVIDFVGESDRPVFPIVITTSSKEGEWYRGHLYQEPVLIFVSVEVVRASVVNEITDLPQLTSELNDALPETKTIPTVRFVLGDGQNYSKAAFGAEQSLKILLEIDKHVPKYSALQSEIREVERRVNEIMRKSRQAAGRPYP